MGLPGAGVPGHWELPSIDPENLIPVLWKISKSQAIISLDLTISILKGTFKALRKETYPRALQQVSAIGPQLGSFEVQISF